MKTTSKRLSRWTRLCVLMAAGLLSCVAALAGEASAQAKAANARQAKQLFHNIYNKVFGPNGCTMTYSINIIGIYKTTGTVSMKGKKFHYTESRYLGWCDGHTLYRADTKKNVVDIFATDKANKDNMLSRFSYDLNKFQYSWQSTSEGIELSVDAPSGVKGVRHAKIIIDRKRMVPTALKIKVAFFWTTVQLPSFREGGINDNIFIFPRKRFAHYQFNDKRNED